MYYYFFCCCCCCLLEWNVTLSTFEIIKFIITFAIVHLFDLTTSSKPYQYMKCMCLLQFLSETNITRHLMIHQIFFVRFSICVFFFISLVRFAYFLCETNSDEHSSVVYLCRLKQKKKQKMWWNFFGLHVVATWPLIQNKGLRFWLYYSTERKRRKKNAHTTNNKWTKQKIKHNP